MKYIVTYSKPTDVTVRERTEEFNGPAQARGFLRQADEYPGSYTIISVEKVTSKGERTYVAL